MKKTTRKLLAVLLAFTMLFGSSMTVFADDVFQGPSTGSGDITIVTPNPQTPTPNPGSGTGGNTPQTPITIVTPNPQTPTPNPGSDTGENTPQTPSTKPVKAEQPAHEHSYSWVTVQEATTGQDGIEEYRCSCGAVAERNVIPAGMAMVKDLVRQIETAPENSTVEIKTEYFTCYTAYIMNALKKRPDVSLKTTFKDYDKDGSIKTFTIPAGKVPDDNELFYGFTYLGNLYGWEE